MPSVMAALPNIGCALCSMPQTLADAYYLTAVLRCQDAKAVEISWGCPKLVNQSQPLVGRSSPW